MLYYMNYLVTQLQDFHLPTWNVHSLADEKIVMMVKSEN